ncbi:MAG: HPP family protein [Bacillota bacterium]
MPYERTAKELMIPLEKCPTVRLEQTVKDAVALLKSTAGSGYRNVLVLDDAGKPAGFVSFHSVLEALQPEFLVTDKWTLPVFWRGFLEAKCREEAYKKVREVMRPISFITIDAQDPITKAVHLMVSHGIQTLPVIEDGKVIGILRSREIFDEVSDLIINQ